MKFSKDILRFADAEQEIDRICKKIKEDVTLGLKRKGVVVGVSGGIDSSVTLALAVRALGPDKVLAIMMPEKESNSDSLRLGKMLAETFGVQSLVENISGALSGFRCYERRDEAIQRVFPEFNPLTYKSKIGINSTGLNNLLPPVFFLTIVDPDGKESRKVIPVKEYLQIVAASNFKQRCRMSMLIIMGSKLLCRPGTANKHEIDQGFFVKHGMVALIFCLSGICIKHRSISWLQN
jgi:NAD+ synthase